MQTQIKIKASDDKVVLDIDTKTTQIFAYVVKLVDDQLNETYVGKGSTGGITTFKLGNGKDLVGLTLIIDWSASDPLGAGNSFLAHGTVTQLGQPCLVVQVFSGTTNDTTNLESTYGKFII